MDLIKLSIYYKNLCITYFLYNQCFSNSNKNVINYNAVLPEIIER